MLSDFSPHLVQDDLPVAALQFSVDEVPSVLLELDTSKAGRQVETFQNEKPIFQKGRRNNVVDFRGVLICLLFPSHDFLSEINVIGNIGL
jgi:hypothetical protein